MEGNRSVRLQDIIPFWYPDRKNEIAPEMMKIIRESTKGLGIPEQLRERPDEDDQAAFDFLLSRIDGFTPEEVDQLVEIYAECPQEEVRERIRVFETAYLERLRRHPEDQEFDPDDDSVSEETRMAAERVVTALRKRFPGKEWLTNPWDG